MLSCLLAGTDLASRTEVCGCQNLWEMVVCLTSVVLASTGKVHHHTSLPLQPAMQVDIVIDETTTVGTSSYTLSTFLSNFNISMADSAEYPFLAKQQVYG